MQFRAPRGHGEGYPVAVAAASLTTGVIALLSHYVSIPNISLLYLPSILATAVYFGTGPSLIAAALAALEYDFFLLRPAFTFTIAQAQDILAFTVFVLVAVISSQLAAGAKARAEALVIIRARAEEERHRRKVLEETDRLKSALLSAVSHDLRTPLASIKASATSLLLADAAWTREEGQELLRTIDHEADRLNRLVGNLLDLSRIEAGALHPALEWYDMPEVTETVLSRLRLVLGGRPFSLEVQPDIPAVRLDLLRVEELLSNLVENAVKYTPPGSPITLRAWHDASGLHLAVEDHGPGIPSGQRRRIFETFYRGQPHSDRNPGTGLGLAICRGIAEAHGGALRVEDTPGGGATFVFTLPPALVEQGVTA